MGMICHWTDTRPDIFQALTFFNIVTPPLPIELALKVQSKSYRKATPTNE